MQKSYRKLREIHDGEFRKDFGTGVTKIWRGRLTMIAAVTPAIDRAYSTSSTLGERFLQVRWHRPPRIAGERAIDQQTAEQPIREDIITAVKEVFAGAISDVPEITNRVRQQLAAIAELVAIGRTHVYRNAYGSREIEDVPEPEANTRVSKGLAAIARGDASLRRAYTVEDVALGDVFRVGLDCIPPLRKEILVAAIYQRPTSVTKKISGKRAKEELVELGLLERDCEVLTLTKSAWDLIRESRLKEVFRDKPT